MGWDYWNSCNKRLCGRWVDIVSKKVKIMEIKKKSGKKSYERGENFIFYPKEEVVKFINRFIKKESLLINILRYCRQRKKLKRIRFWFVE